MSTIDVLHLIGRKNERYGICGFVCALSALFEHSPELLAPTDRFEKKHLSQWFRTDILTFLNKTKDNTEISDGINSLTQHLTGNNKWNIQSYMNAVASYKPGMPKSVKYEMVKKDEIPGKNYSMAMTKKALSEYIKIAFEYSTIESNVSSFSEAPCGSIIGIGKKDVSKPEGGLKHYIYKNKKGELYSWGVNYSSWDNFKEYTESDESDDEYEKKYIYDVLFYIQLAVKLPKE